LIDENVIKKTRNDLIMRKSETLIKLWNIDECRCSN
jgi:hypothetical protein